MKKILVGLIFCATLPTMAQTEVIKMSEAKGDEQGLAYSLPKTVLRIDITSSKYSRTAGPCYKYAERYLGVKDPIIENSVRWEIDKITVNPVAVPDLEQSYMILFKGTPAPIVDLTSDGMIRSINIEFPDEESAQLKPAATLHKEEAGDANMKVMSEELLMAGSVGKMAETAARQIYKIRESRTDLITGNIDNLPSDGESFKLMLRQLDDQEKALTELFIGTVEKETKVVTLDIEPTEDFDKRVIGRFSRFSGVVDKDDLSGSPLYLTLKTVEKREMPVDPKAGKGKKGIFYRIPAKIQLSLFNLEGREYVKESYQIAQMGSVISLSPNLFGNKKAPVKVVFEPALGAIRQLIQ